MSYCGYSQTGQFAGVDAITLQLWLTQARQAKIDLMTGGKPVTVEVTGGGQHRSVTYSRAELPALNAFIMELMTALGIRPVRSALSVSF